jgi:gentisate 1,2-dioxygenase
VKDILKQLEIILNKNMDIKSLEIKLVKSSQIEDGDIIIVKIDEEYKKNLTKQDIKDIYESINNMINKKNIEMYFFPKSFDFEIIKNHVTNFEQIEKKIIEKQEKSNNE